MSGDQHSKASANNVALTDLYLPTLPARDSLNPSEDLWTNESHFEIDASATNVALREDIPPNGGYGWVVTVCTFLINFQTWGVNAAWAIFLAQYLAHSTFPEATLFEYALIGGLSISQALIASPVVAISMKRLGTRTTLLIGTVLEFASLFSAAYSTKIWHLVMSQGLCFGWGMGFLYIPASSVLPQWFSSKRSLAVGIATSGAGVGGLAYSLIAGRAIEALGTSWTYRILAFCSLGINLVASLLFRDRNKSVKPQQTAFDYREFGNIEVILVTIWGLMTELGYIVLLYSLPNYANQIGLSHSQGSVVGAFLSLGLGIGRPIVGYLSDKFGRINVAMAMTAFCGIICLAMWVPARSYGVLLTFALFAGTACGTFWGTSTSVVAEVVGLQRLPSAFSMILLALVLPTTFAEPIGLQIVSARGYLSSQIFVGCMFLAGAASTWLLRCWKICDTERKALAEQDDAQAVARHGHWLTLRRLFLTLSQKV